MNRNGTHVGRPAYTPEQRMEASALQFKKGLTWHDGDHWHQSRSYFQTPDGRKVRKAKFSMMLAYPDVEFGPDDRIYVKCPDKDCVNPKHMTCVDANKPIHLNANGEPMSEEDFIKQATEPGQTAIRRRRALQQLKMYWRENPVPMDSDAAHMRVTFMPEVDYNDAAAVDKLFADHGIVESL